MKGALGYGGPCFPRDNLAFSALARGNGVPPILAEATHQLNQSQAPRLAKWILARLPEGGTVGVMGLSYKPNTEVIEESQGLALAKRLLSVGVPVVVYDPAAMENARPQLVGKVTFATSAADAIWSAFGFSSGKPYTAHSVSSAAVCAFESLKP